MKLGEALARRADLERRIKGTEATDRSKPGGAGGRGAAARSYCKALRSIHLTGVGEQSQWGMRTMRSELRLLPTIDAKESQRRADEAARRFREIDARIQEINWTTELK